MKRWIAVTMLGLGLLASPCAAEMRTPGSRVAAAVSPTVISQDPLTKQIMQSLTLPNGGVRSFTQTGNAKTIELVGGADALAPLKPVDGLVQKDEPIKAVSKTKTPPKAMPQLERVAAKKASL